MFVTETLSGVCSSLIIKAITSVCHYLTNRTIVDGVFIAEIEFKMKRLLEDDKYKPFHEPLREFLSLPLVADILQQYFSYKITATIKLEEEVKNPTVIIHDNYIANKYYEKYRTYHTESLNSQEETLLREFFKSFLAIALDTILQKINTENKAELIVQNSRLDGILLHVIGRLDEIQDRLSHSLDASIVPKNENYRITQEKYNHLLQLTFSKSFIYLLDEYEFSEFYIPPILMKASILNSSKRIFRVNSDYEQNSILKDAWKNIFLAHNIVYIVGKAGYGKSLLLKKIVNSYTELNLMSPEEHLVIYCDLKSFYTKGSSSKKSILDFLQESMIAHTGLDETILTKDFIEYHLNIGRCIILFDALDEVAKEHRKSIHRMIINYFSSYSPNNKICITSRDRGFIPQNKIDVLNIMPLSKQNISDYLDKMIALGKFKSSEKATFLRQSVSLMRKQFLDNFLVLSLLVSIYRSERKLPSNKVELYKKCFDYIFKEREQEKLEPGKGYDWSRLGMIMKESTFTCISVLAAPTNHNIKQTEIFKTLFDQYKKKFASIAETEIAINEFLTFCSDRTELLVLSDNDEEYRFFHRSFFEYFYARYLNQQINIEKIYTLLVEFDVDSEVFELVAALLKEENESRYQALVEYIFKNIEDNIKKSNLSSRAFSALTLIMQVVDDALYIRNYFYLVIKCHTLCPTGVNSMSVLDSLVASWINKELCNSKDAKAIFFDTYKKDILLHFSMFFYRLKNPTPSRKMISENNSYYEEYILSEYLNYSISNSFERPRYFITVTLINDYWKDITASLAADEYNKLLSEYEDIPQSTKMQSLIGLKYYQTLEISKQQRIMKVLRGLYE